MAGLAVVKFIAWSLFVLSLLLFVLSLFLTTSSACSKPQRARSNTPTAIPVLFHVENDFIVVEISIDGYSGNLRCLQRIDRFPKVGPPDCQTCEGSFKDERCYWVPDEHAPDTPGGLWQAK